MKTIQSRFIRSAVVTVALALAAVCSARAGEPTAFELVKEGNRYVGEQSKDKIVELHSDKSIGSLTPNTWYIVYYDPDATFKGNEVKFVGGKKENVKRPITSDRKVLDSTKLNTDSDAAIRIASEEPGLKPVTLKAAQLWLRLGDLGPEWKVKLWAAKLSNPNKMAEVGEVFIDANDGKVLRTDIHIKSVD